MWFSSHVKENDVMSQQTLTTANVHGYVRSDFEAVRAAFAENFAQRKELGAACCIYHRGEKVVDLWGGIRNRATGEPWEEETMTLVFSASKGAAAMVMALAHSRGWLAYDERVCTYWPEFAHQGKDSITVRQLLAHQAGLFGFEAKVDRSVIADLDRLARVMEEEKAAWPPGDRQAYHAISLGFYEGELVRRVDPQHRSLGQVFQEEIATPLGEEFYIRLPDEIPNSRLAPLDMASPWKAMLGLPLPLTVAAMNPRSVLYHSLITNPGTLVPLEPERVYARNLEIPSGGGVGTARALAHAYSVFATGGAELGLRRATLDALAEPARPSRHGFYDECMKADAHYSLGFMKPFEGWAFASPSGYGAPGAGGSLAFADPERQVGYAYVPNRMGVKIDGDPREMALRKAMEASVAEVQTWN
jgi:CubicO group peptidase (beta-lactamase class C family)